MNIILFTFLSPIHLQNIQLIDDFFLKYIFFFILQICIKRHLLPSCLCLQLDRLWAVLSGTGIFLLEQRITVIRDQLAITCRTLLPIDKAHCTVLFSFLYISYLSYSEFIFFFQLDRYPRAQGEREGEFSKLPFDSHTITQQGSLIPGSPLGKIDQE